MGHLFYKELGGVRNGAVGGYDLQPGPYWSGTPDSLTVNAPFGAKQSWYLDFSRGFQDVSGQTYGFYAWAVRDGDVASVTTPIPEPEAYAMMLAGLGLLGFMTRRKKPA